MNNKVDTLAPHPGEFIRQNVLPAGLSVKAASDRLGVGRPALSNLLNGKASLSPEMALRLEKTFGANQSDLLNLQAAYDRAKVRGTQSNITVRPYVPPFLKIKAADIGASYHRH